jgi:hypothetical protein
MPPDHIMFAGVELSSGRKPVVFAALDSDLNVLSLQNWAIAEALSCLEVYKKIWLCINCIPSSTSRNCTQNSKRKSASRVSSLVPGRGIQNSGSRRTPRIASAP